MLQNQDIAYFFVIAAIWTSVLAVASPGTGLLEVAACVCIVISAVFAVFLGVNVWALGILAAAFLVFQNGAGETAAVYWPLAVILSVGTLGFFWFVVRKTLQARRQPAHMNPSAVVGKVGVAQTEIFKSGSVQAASELWSARSDAPIAAGTRVRVVAREGLVLKVEKEA